VASTVKRRLTGGKLLLKRHGDKKGKIKEIKVNGGKGKKGKIKEIKVNGGKGKKGKRKEIKVSHLF
jgi:hypothetical protein